MEVCYGKLQIANRAIFFLSYFIFHLVSCLAFFETGPWPILDDDDDFLGPMMNRFQSLETD